MQTQSDFVMGQRVRLRDAGDGRRPAQFHQPGWNGEGGSGDCSWLQKRLRPHRRRPSRRRRGWASSHGAGRCPHRPGGHRGSAESRPSVESGGSPASHVRREMRPDPATARQTVRSGLCVIHGLLAPALRESARSRPTRMRSGKTASNRSSCSNRRENPPVPMTTAGSPTRASVANLADQLAKHRPVAEVEAGLDAFDRRPADELSGRDDFNIGKTRRIPLEGLHRHPQAGDDDAAQEVAAGADHIDSRHRSQAHDNQMAIRIEVGRPDGVGDTVRAHFLWVAVANLQAGLGPRLENERIDLEILAAAAPQRVDDIRERRNRRRSAPLLKGRSRSPGARLAGTTPTRRTTLAAAKVCETAPQAHPAGRPHRRSDYCRRRGSGSRAVSKLDVVDEAHAADAHCSKAAAIPIGDVVHGEPLAAQITGGRIRGRSRGQDSEEMRGSLRDRSDASRRFRELRARPSDSRTVAQETMTVRRKNAAAMSRTSSNCCQSFSPKYARSARQSAGA